MEKNSTINYENGSNHRKINKVISQRAEQIEENHEQIGKILLMSGQARKIITVIYCLYDPLLVTSIKYYEIIS